MTALHRTGAYPRQDGDYYPTPNGVTECLLKTIHLRGFILEACAGAGAMARVIADAGYTVVATDLVRREPAVYPIITGINALTAPLPAGVESVVTNPPFGKLVHTLVPYWLELLEPVHGILALVLKSAWGESKTGQNETSRHPAFLARIKLPTPRVEWFAGTGTGQHDYCWYIWDWHKDPAKAPLELVTGDSRLRRPCVVCGESLGDRRADAKTCSNVCRVTLSKRRRQRP